MASGKPEIDVRAYLMQGGGKYLRLKINVYTQKLVFW